MPGANTNHRVLIVGGGFGGLQAAKALKHAEVQVTLVDRRNFHLFQPLLYQVATGELSPANIAAPLRSILEKQKNVQVLLAEVVDFDPDRRRLILSDGELAYDTLILAAGAGHYYFGHDEWQTFAPGLKTIEDATEIRRRIFLAFEAAERESDREQIRRWLTFVVVGGGPTGVELAGALAEISRHTLQHQFRTIDPSDAQIILIEGADRILPVYPAALSEKAEQQLTGLGVTVRTGTMVGEIHEDSISIRSDAGRENIETRTTLWGAGVKASPLGLALAKAVGVETDRMGRVPVLPDLTVPGHPEIFVVGDIANLRGKQGEPLPGVAPVAVQEGRYAAKVIRRRLRGKKVPPFAYWDYGTMATIGRSKAVAMIGPLRFSGFTAWLAWLFVHLMKIVGFQNRVLVLTRWAWNYWSWNRTARLITGTNILPQINSGHGRD